METPHTQSSESCSYATSWYLLPVRPINYSPKYRSQGKETPRMGRQDRAALSQLKERSQIKRMGGGVKGRKTKKGRALLSPFFFLTPPPQPALAYSSLQSPVANVLESCTHTFLVTVEWVERAGSVVNHYFFAPPAQTISSNGSAQNRRLILFGKKKKKKLCCFRRWGHAPWSMSCGWRFWQENHRRSDRELH